MTQSIDKILNTLFRNRSSSLSARRLDRAIDLIRLREAIQILISHS